MRTLVVNQVVSRVLGAALALVMSGVATPVFAQAAPSGAIVGAARSLAGAPIAKMKITIVAGSKVVEQTVSANDGGFNFARLPYGTYTVQCVAENGQVTGTTSVTLSAASTNVRVTCANETPAAYNKKKPLALLAGLGAAAVAIGAVAVVATGNDASGSR